MCLVVNSRMDGEEWIAAIREGRGDEVRRLLEENGELVGFRDRVRSFFVC